jgi:hypothetical protein
VAGLSLSLTAEERGLLMLRDNLEVFSAHCLKVLPKEGGKAVPFVWNRAQRFIHEKLEEQLQTIGRVRALVLKGRQQGCSTYVGARFYHKASMRFGQGAFIVAHEEKATANLFKMVKRYHDLNPIAPTIKASNAQELVFGKLDSGYKLATAGSQDVGRSNTARLLHGSEFAFWANAQSHLAGLGNTIPSGELGYGTEIVLESTANGLGNAFHLMWQLAEIGIGEYLAIFVPWFWQGEYRSEPKSDFVLSDEDVRYMEAYGLDIRQMAWRANKIAEYGEGYEWLFDQEYPATAALAFRAPTGRPLINPTLVQRAIHSGYMDRTGPLIIGVDPASDGVAAGLERDRTAVVFRRGRVVLRTEAHLDMPTMEVASMLAQYNAEHRPAAIIIDKGGIGAGIHDRLKELNVPVIGVMFGEGARDRELHLNRRAEMWWAIKEWLEDAPCRLPNDAALQADLSAPQPIERSDRKRQLESKKDMAKRGIRSPDLGDALALTFAEPVQALHIGGEHHGDIPSGKPATNAGY